MPLSNPKVSDFPGVIPPAVQFLVKEAVMGLLYIARGLFRREEPQFPRDERGNCVVTWKRGDKSFPIPVSEAKLPAHLEKYTKAGWRLG